MPQHRVAPGESFQVQYVLENALDVSGFSAPPFQGFRIVSGPNVYSGDKPTSYRNWVFTLAAVTEGTFKIHGAVCSINGSLIKSNDAYVKVMAPDPSDESPYLLLPGEDPFEKIRQNLFIKLSVDKQSCFIGEPLVATFKLYSRLQSKSDVIKNPGFYGFGVYDMVSVNDRVTSEEKMKGRWFDVHTIRKVQLYPLQAGTFTIDAMELSNKIEFSRSTVNNRTEQEVIENMYNKEPEDKPDPKAEVYEMTIKSEPMVIKVKSLPLKTVADTFTGAVGDFAIKALIEQDTVLRNQENALTVEIAGAGNFQTISGPLIKWPPQIEAFESSVTEKLDKQKIPLAGYKRFKYVFLTDKAGKYVIPPITFSFFQLKTKRYRTVSTKPIAFFVASGNKAQLKLNSQRQKTTSQSNTIFWFSGLALLLVAIALLWLRIRQERQRNTKKIVTPSADISSVISIENCLRPAELVLDKNDKQFYSELKQSIWNYLNQHLHLAGSQMNKTDLARILMARRIDQATTDELVNVIHECERHIYTNAETDLSHRELLGTTRRILKAMEEKLA